VDKTKAIVKISASYYVNLPKKKLDEGHKTFLVKIVSKDRANVKVLDSHKMGDFGWINSKKLQK